MGQLYYYDAGSSSWLPTQVGAQGPQGTQGNQGFQGFQGASILPTSATASASVTATAGQVTTCNPGATTLSAAITTTSATSITVTSATGFPSSGNYYILIDQEIMLVTAGQGTTTWTVTRAQLSTTAATHLISSNVLQILGVTLPASPSNGTICAVYVLGTATGTVTVTAGSGNTLDYAVGRLYAGQSAYLVYNSTTTSWVSPTQNNQQSNPAGTIYLTATQSVIGGIYFTVAFDTNLYTMKGGMTRINNGLMAPIAGIYNIGFVWSCAVGTNLFLSKNGGAAIQYLNGNANTFSASLNISLVAGDYITLGGFPFTTGAITNGSSGTVMSMYLVSQ